MLLRKLLLASALFVVSLYAVDITGKWSGKGTVSADGENRDRDVFLDFKQEGTSLTGVAGEHSGDTVPIRNGKVNGEDITFEVPTDGAVYKVSLKAEGDSLVGRATGIREDGTTVAAKLTLQKQK